MKKFIAFITVFALAVSMLGIAAFAEEAKTFNNPYVKDGLVALYQGDFNTANGQDKAATTWADLSGNGYDIEEIPADSATWTDNGLDVSATKIYLPTEIKDTINSNNYTVEFAMEDFVVESIGSQFATFVNNDGNDNFSLFLRVNAGTNNLEFKCAGNERTKVPDGRETLDGGKVTLTVTFEEDGDICFYVNGELMDTKTQLASMNVDGEMFIGHPDATRHYDATIKSVRFYDRALGEDEVLANAVADGYAEAPAPTAEPTAKPTAAPTAEPTAEPTDAPTAEPTETPKDGGCGSTVATFGIVLMLAGAAITMKKKEN